MKHFAQRTNDGSTTNSKEVGEVMLLGKVDGVLPAGYRARRIGVSSGSLRAEVEGTHDSWLGSTRVRSKIS